MKRDSGFVPFLLVAGLMVCGAAQARTVNVRANETQGPAAELVKEARALGRKGENAAALARYRKALEISPNLLEAREGAGATLDLLGEYKQAREEFAKAIQIAPAKQRPRALKMMAISYAFTCQPGQAEKYEQQTFDLQVGAKDFYAAGETADELARIYLECGNVDDARAWYQKGHDTGLRKPGIAAAERALWDFRLQHALARIAARQGERAEAEKHVAEAKALLAKGFEWKKQQEQFLPYLTGYVAFYLGEYKVALADLQRANQHDPFILTLIAQTYEKLGDKTKAMASFREALKSNAHNPPNAFARPLARKMVESAVKN